VRVETAGQCVEYGGLRRYGREGGHRLVLAEAGRSDEGCPTYIINIHIIYKHLPCWSDNLPYI